MKKVFALLMMLAMVAVCGSAMAVTVEGGTKGTHWHFNDKEDVLYIDKDGTYTVSGWDGKQIYIASPIGTVNLTLNNVHISGDDIGIRWWMAYTRETEEDAVLNLTMNNSSINTKKEPIYVHVYNIAKTYKTRVTVTGNNAVLNSTASEAIEVSSTGSYGGELHLTLGGTMKMTGRPSVINGQYVYIDGTVLPGIHAEVSENADGSSSTQLEGSPFSEKSNDVSDEIGSNKFLRLYKPEAPAAPADVPQTGDESRLAMWLCLLALAGAGMTAMRKREA